jgi:hypothetical protein
MVGLETLELAQGVIWSQSLHLRDPQLENVPESLASDLEQILQAVATKSAINACHNEAPARTPHDTLHVNSSRMYALVREIRALPGLDRFMLGEAFEILRTAAHDHPVVVLVGARERYYALVMAPWLADKPTLISLNLSDEDWKNLLLTSSTKRAYRSAAAVEETLEVYSSRNLSGVGLALICIAAIARPCSTTFALVCYRELQQPPPPRCRDP